MKKIAILYFLGALLLSGCVRDEFDTTRVEEGLAAHVGLKMMIWAVNTVREAHAALPIPVL